MPVFKHDCPRCQFHSTVVDRYGQHDIYVCRGSVDGLSFIARHSDEDSDYSSVSAEVFSSQLNATINVPQEHRTPLFRDWVLELDESGNYKNGAWRVAWLRIYESLEVTP
jgi:hypothetical protein